METRATQYQYDTDGRYVEAETQYLNFSGTSAAPVFSRALTTNRSYHSVLGALRGETSPNNQSSALGFTKLGRLNYEWSANGSFTTVSQALCSTSCPTDGYYLQTTTVSDGPDSVEYFDVNNRKIAEKTQTLRTYNGSTGSIDWIWTRYRYDLAGRMTAQSVPYFGTSVVTIETEGAGIGNLAGYNYTVYDAIDRVTAIAQANGGSWTTSYTGLSKTTTNPDLYTKTEVVNALGELTSVVDNNLNTISYAYDALGNVRSIARQDSDAISFSTTIKHDHMGRKVQMVDPDKGTIDYQHDVLGQAIWQQDNKNQITRQNFDGFGRVTSKIKRYGTSSGDETGVIDQQYSWTFDTADYGLGLVDTVTDHVNNITDSVLYNVLSLPVKSTSNIDGELYRQYTQYDDDNEFRVSTTYDASGSNAGVDYSYYGDYLVSKTDKVSGAVVWQFNASDAWGNITQFTQGNGVTTINVHDTNDGTYERISSSIQDLEYQFDSIGNLEYREDNNANMRESFTYDNLNRLDVTTLTVNATSATFNVDYDHLGNITFKTGVGTYHYANGRPHAVSSITGGDLAGSFVYDDNGNMTSGGGRNDIRYNTMDKPTYIQTSNKVVSYQYGMGGSRFKRIDNDGSDITSTLYVGNTEFISKNGTLTEVQRQIAGVALETYFPVTGVRKLEFLHYDHLGSIDVITDNNGTVLQKFSYDAWGQRRNAGTFMTGSFSSVDRAISFQRGNFKRGFTGHEHIDDAGLIHMNGRVYDPRLGRFMSADPIVSAGDNLQAYNRYSYVLNNPLNATDPSGYNPVAMVVMAALSVAAEYYYIAYVALQIYSVYSLVEGVYGAIQAFKYDQGVMGVIALAQAAYSAYNLYQGGGGVRIVGRLGLLIVGM